MLGLHCHCVVVGGVGHAVAEVDGVVERLVGGVPDCGGNVLRIKHAVERESGGDTVADEQVVSEEGLVVVFRQGTGGIRLGIGGGGGLVRRGVFLGRGGRGDRRR